ncbi:MAG: hypothetical protein ACYSWS_03710 [Planctomycetota bacterium]|jgi:hypothetical protein
MMTGIGMDAGTRDTIAMIGINIDTGVMGTSIMVKSVANVVKFIVILIIMIKGHPCLSKAQGCPFFL